MDQKHKIEITNDAYGWAEMTKEQLIGQLSRNATGPGSRGVDSVFVSNLIHIRCVQDLEESLEAATEANRESLSVLTSALKEASDNSTWLGKVAIGVAAAAAAIAMLGVIVNWMRP